MKTLFLKENRLKRIILDRNKRILRLLKNSAIKVPCSVKLSTKEFKDGISFGWEITYDEKGHRFGETVQKETIEPTGNIISLQDIFRPVENIGVFPKPKIER